MEAIYITAGLILGFIIGFIIRKLSFEKDYVSKSEFNSTHEQLQNLKAKSEYFDKEQTRLNQELNAAKLELHEKNDEITALAGNFAAATTTIENLSAQSENLKNIEKNHLRQIDTLNAENTNLKTTLAQTKAKLESQEKELKNIGEKFTNEFKVLANSILEEKSKRFTEQNESNLRNLLEPLGKNISEFKKKVEETYDKESKQRFSLEEKIKELAALNLQISTEAKNLTNALKGDSKQQGDWGEMILENLLENSGLQKGREYFVQEFLRNDAGQTVSDENGRKMQPDVVINYPDKRKIIIDSKVSLTAYEKYVSEENPAEQKILLKEHINSLKRHIDGLSGKKYHEFAADTLDFVMMFVPIEPAYLDAVRADRTLWDYAYKKRVILISPTNLIAALKLVADLWQREYQNQNAIEIADRGGKLYDKFVGFIENMNEIGINMAKAQKSYDDAFKQLQTGSGNLIGQVEKLKKLGVKAQKTLSLKSKKD